ncbi:MAG: hypothetical protein MUF35_03540 [Candidatus Nanopelagicales bacterium]|jgi:hypothetical protein|nr:hypothetical protein [Candidatus Nanopelagicales bacterium]
MSGGHNCPDTTAAEHVPKYCNTPEPTTVSTVVLTAGPWDALAVTHAGACASAASSPPC